MQITLPESSLIPPGHSLDSPWTLQEIHQQSVKNHREFLPKSTKINLGWLWAPLGLPWTHLGHPLGPGRQKPAKSDFVDPPPGVPKRILKGTKMTNMCSKITLESRPWKNV